MIGVGENLSQHYTTADRKNTSMVKILIAMIFYQYPECNATDKSYVGQLHCASINI